MATFSTSNTGQTFGEDEVMEISSDSSSGSSSDSSSDSSPGSKAVLTPKSLPKSRPTAIDRDVLTTGSLDALQSTDQRTILDIVDKLRRTGLSNVLELPQLVVCGDQSSGKSSVLEAITEIPFPRKENLCTRFATEIVLRREPTSSIATRINPDKNRPISEHAKLLEFARTIEDFSELPALIEEATTLMGLGDLKSGNAKAFARDVLTIEICGPNRPQITLVDLPGLIHSENKVQSKHDVQLIRDLVEDYIQNPRTIILAVISAKNDYANQIILNRVREVDNRGRRTLGIITKPDTLREGSDNEKDWIELAQNENICFELGWHMLKNRADGDGDMSFEARNQSEALFFSRGLYNELSNEDKGIVSLRNRLSELLSAHLKREIPDLKKELDLKLKATEEELSRLGQKRSTVSEQRQFLMGIATDIHDILRSAIQGHYEHPFFGMVDAGAPIDSQQNWRRLRAAVQFLNIKFAEKVRTDGKKYDLEDPPDLMQDGKRISAAPAVQGKIPQGRAVAKRMDRNAAIQWVLRILQRTRGRELPGNFNPMLISQLFWEQSEPWEGIAMAHIDKVADGCKEFVDAVLEHVTTIDVGSRLLGLHIDKALANSLDDARKELTHILKDKASFPITYNHYYTTNIQKSRAERFKKNVLAKTKEVTVNVTTANPMAGGPFGQTAAFAETKQYIDPGKLMSALDRGIEQDMDVFSAEDALDSQSAFYKDEMKFFIGVVCKQVIERHIVAKLPDNVISPNFVAGLTDEQIKYVAGEPIEITRQRHHLQTRKDMLEKGQQSFRYAMGGLR